MIGGFSRSVETTAGRSGRGDGVRGQAPAASPQRIGQLDAVGDVQVQRYARSLQRYARSHHAAAKRRIAVAGDASRFEAASKTTAPDLVSIEQERLDLDR